MCVCVYTYIIIKNHTAARRGSVNGIALEEAHALTIAGVPLFFRTREPRDE
jgi:hypothetical protein